MKLRQELRKNITGESLAYGYTLAVWGSGALLLNSFSTQPIDILSFVFGGVAGFTALAFLAFRTFVDEVKYDVSKDFIVSSTIHILASFGTVLINYIFITQLGDAVQKEISFIIVGFNATFLYNLLLLVEEYLSEDLYRFEKSLQKEGGEIDG